MKLSAPSNRLFAFTVISVIIAVVAKFMYVPVVSGYEDYVIIAAFILLALGNIVKKF